MAPYFTVLLLSVVFYYGYVKTQFRIFTIATLIVLVYLVGMRSLTVGTDTSGYVHTFMAIGESSTWQEAINSYSTEKGWVLFNWLVYRLQPH